MVTQTPQRLAPAPEQIRLFHITAIENLPSIMRRGALLAKNVAQREGAAYANIAHAGAQGSRSRKLMPNPPGGQLHDYVPFYFAPRSPMLMAIHGGKVAGCAFKQDEIVHFETTVANVLTSGQAHVIFDRNATLDYSKAYTDVRHLSAVAWDLLHETPQLDGFCKYFQNRRDDLRYVDRMERRQAEFLTHTAVPLHCFTRIGVCTEAAAHRVRDILVAAGVRLHVEVCPQWYFLGQ
ncbi:MAG: DUF4433 domain-containing protein [Burkholderiales bacterium]|nr:MAG: DUF4433 domain-containing protein [Burkholderiales bacterium]